MTSSNISNMLVQTVNSVNSVMNDMKAEHESTFNVSFNKTLQVATKGAQAKLVGNLDNNSKSKPDVVVDNAKRIKVKSDDKLQKSDTTDEQVVNEVPEELEGEIKTFDAKVKELVEDALDVSGEELEEAMANLGLVPLDLMNPQNLANLVIELDESVDSVELLMDGDFKDLLDGITGLTNQLLEEFNLSPIEIKDYMISIEEVEMGTQTNLTQEAIVFQEPETSEEYTTDEGYKMVIEQPKVENINNLESTAQEDVDVEDNTGIIASSTQISDEADNLADNSNDFMGRESHESKLNFKELDRDDGAVTIINPEKNFETVYFAEKDSIALPNGENVSTQEIIDQVVEHAKIINESDVTTMEMILKPEGLGKIVMEISQKGEEITAKIFTENESVKEALENQMASLRTQMNDSSTKVTSIEVSVGTHEFEKNLEEDARNQQNSEQHQEHKPKQGRRIDLNSLDGLSGLMTDEEQLVYQIMRENGNTLDYQV